MTIRVRYEQYLACPICGGKLNDGSSINEINLGNGYKRWKRWQWCNNRMSCGWWGSGTAVTPGLAEILKLRPTCVEKPLTECPY